MESDRMTSRVVLRHVQVILLAVLLAVGIDYLMLGRQTASYTASARLSIATDAPKSSAEADALTARARGLATSRSILAGAAKAAHVDRDPGQLAGKVSLQGLGSSPLANLSITDRDPVAATALTAATAQAVVKAINDASIGGLPTVLGEMDRQLNVLTTQRAAVAAQLIGMQPGPEQLQLLSKQAGLDQELQDLASQRSRLVVDAAAGPRADVIDSPHGLAAQDRTNVASDLVLAGIVGLLAGLAVAGLLETVRPVVADAKRLSLLAEAPVLGDLVVRDGSFDPAQMAHMRRVLMLAASNARVATVVLLGPVHEATLGTLAAALDGEMLPALPAVPVAVARGGPATAESAETAGAAGLNGDSGDMAGAARELRVHTLATLDGASATRIAAVVVASAGVPRKQLASVDDFVRAAGWPVIGVAMIHASSWLSGGLTTRRRNSAADSSHRRSS
jgi:hypothetical protein